PSVQLLFVVWIVQYVTAAKIALADRAAVLPAVTVAPVTGSGSVPDVHGRHRQKDGPYSHRPCMAHPVLTGHEDPAHFAHAINVAGQVFVPGVHMPVVQSESADAVPVQPLAAVAAGRADAVPLGVADAFPEWF